MNTVQQISSLLKNHAPASERTSSFFKTGKGEYAEHDIFIGVPVPVIRAIAQEYLHLSTDELEQLLHSPINEERLLALIILVAQYTKADIQKKEETFQFYLQNLEHVNNWNLVDSSAHLIIGAHLFDTDRSLLLLLAQSDNLWKRRVAIVATWYFIRKNDLSWTFDIALILKNDTHDLIHKAIGWMLREAGKRNEGELISFLNQYAEELPRTTVRYAIERLPEDIRKSYLVTRKPSISR
jgi:3-methyladenine DNA glycosylase AlkD